MKGVGDIRLPTVGDDWQDRHGKKCPLLYCMVERLSGVEPYGWIAADKYLPMTYDLVKVKTKLGRVYGAWWTGTEWIGLRKRSHDEIVAWHRVFYRDGDG